MTPYRERREQGHYNPDGETPDSTHSHHLAGLQTATHPPEVAAEEPETTEEPETDSTDDLADLTKAELIDLAKERGVTPANAAMSKDELREALESA